MITNMKEFLQATLAAKTNDEQLIVIAQCTDRVLTYFADGGDPWLRRESRKELQRRLRLCKPN